MSRIVRGVDVTSELRVNIDDQGRAAVDAPTFYRQPLVMQELVTAKQKAQARLYEIEAAIQAVGRGCRFLRAAE